MIKVGCCGTAGLSLMKYSKTFNLIEIQSSFYNLPKIETAERWRETVPEDFEFTMKAFQGVTHPASSPTWRRSRRQIMEGMEDDVGLLRPSKFVKESWSQSVMIAEVLRAKIIVVQLPPVFEYNAVNIARISQFLEDNNSELKVSIEFRHNSWLSKLQEVMNIFNKYGAILVTDPLKMEIPPQKIQYHRLHGSDGFTNYTHEYTEEELLTLRDKVKAYDSYVLFNNISMRHDAIRFKQLVV
ncbi:MAG: DUF72 domain-containing protein [Nitrososphaerota archaeon]